MKLLYAEDERGMSEAVVDILQYHHYSVDAVYDGEEALYYAENEEYDGIILDVMMPKMDGIEVLRRLRSHGNHTPILLLTAKSEVDDQVLGLNSGADDYLPKPFSTKLLLARLAAMLRRRVDFTPTVLQYGNITLNQQTYELSNGEQSFVLPKLEYQLMELFLLNKERCFSTEDLLCKIWGYDAETDLGTVWVYISYLRKRLAALNADIIISTKRNLGYKLEKKP